MSNRHAARSVVLQTLFEVDSEQVDRSRTEEILKRNAGEFLSEATTGLYPFMQQLLDTTLAKQPEIDAIIEKAAPEWPLEKIAVVDRNILRMGLAELLYADREQVPPKVAINEAIELGKEFGGESSGRFINGVLGAVYKEMGEPGKEQNSKKKVDPATLRTEELVGAVVYAQDEGSFYMALVHDVFGHWTLTKGKLTEGETPEQGASRKVKEEIGLTATIEEELGENTYIASDPEEGKKNRHCRYFLAKAPFDELALKSEGGLDDARWFKLTDIVDLNFYDDVLPVITRAVNILAQQTNK